MSNWLARMFTVPKKDRDKINTTLEQNPELLAFVNMIKSVATGAAVSAATDHISDPLAHAAAAVAITTAVERAVPTPHAQDDPATVADVPLKATALPLQFPPSGTPPAPSVPPTA